MPSARAIAATAAVTLAIVLLLAATFVYSGLYDVSAATPHSRVMTAFMHTVSDRSIETHAARLTPPNVDASGILEGAEHFHEMCVVCHGAPGVAKDEFAEGLNPRAPELSRHAAGELSVGEIFWVVRNGIRFTGMPGFQQSHTDDQIWEIAAFVKRMDRMTDAQYEAVIREVMKMNGDSVPPGSNGAAHVH